MRLYHTDLSHKSGPLFSYVSFSAAVPVQPALKLVRQSWIAIVHFDVLCIVIDLGVCLGMRLYLLVTLTRYFNIKTKDIAI